MLQIILYAKQSASCAGQMHETKVIISTAINCYHRKKIVLSQAKLLQFFLQIVLFTQL